MVEQMVMMQRRIHFEKNIQGELRAAENGGPSQTTGDKNCPFTF